MVGRAEALPYWMGRIRGIWTCPVAPRDLLKQQRPVDGTSRTGEFGLRRREMTRNDEMEQAGREQ